MKILIAGTGAMADEFEKYLDKGVELVGYIETAPNKKCKNEKQIYTYDELKNLIYDKIIVANIYSDEIKHTIDKVGVEKERVIFLRPWTEIGFEEGKSLFHWDDLREIAPNYIEEKLNCDRRYFIANKMWLDDIKDTVLNKYKVQQRDYFRYRTFELVADQISELKGEVAEVGVFQGEFAQIINAKFPKRKLYLFDTFESFDKKEFDEEQKVGNCKEDCYKAFTYTSERKVIDRMPNPEKCIIRKGLFPMTAEGIDDEFIFASIDVDFEKSIYECVKWFYPRMVQGGIIFVHDYNNKQFFGVRKAIERYEKEMGKLKKVPLGDQGGTLVVIK